MKRSFHPNNATQIPHDLPLKTLAKRNIYSGSYWINLEDVQAVALSAARGVIGCKAESETTVWVCVTRGHSQPLIFMTVQPYQDTEPN